MRRATIAYTAALLAAAGATPAGAAGLGGLLEKLGPAAATP
jgi:hypothetical protein